MSRIGKKIITIPEKTEVSVSGSTVTVKGPLGELKRTFHPEIIVKSENGTVVAIPAALTLKTKALWGTVTSHIENMVAGVNKLYEKRLIIDGVGYKVDVKPNDLTFSLGFSHTIAMPIPSGVKVALDKGILVITSIDKDLIGQFSAGIRSLKKPEPYKGKGIHYENEIIRRKQGKKTV